MDIKITYTNEDGYHAYTLTGNDAVEWRAEVARLEADPGVTQVTARQAAPIVQYAYNRPEEARA